MSCKCAVRPGRKPTLEIKTYEVWCPERGEDEPADGCCIKATGEEWAIDKWAEDANDEGDLIDNPHSVYIREVNKEEISHYRVWGNVSVHYTISKQ